MEPGSVVVIIVINIEKTIQVTITVNTDVSNKFLPQYVAQSCRSIRWVLRFLNFFSNIKICGQRITFTIDVPNFFTLYQCFV